MVSDIPFANALLGSTIQIRVIQVTNTGTSTLTLDTPSVTQTGSAPTLPPLLFPADCATDGLQLNPHEDCLVLLGYKPKTLGTPFREILLLSPPTVELLPSPLTELDKYWVLIRNTAEFLTFGSQAIGTISAFQSVTLTNSTSETVTVDSVSIVGPNEGDFILIADTCSLTPVPLLAPVS